jgi:hypothetical protein
VKVYPTRPWTTDDLKIAIQKQISAIPENMTRRAPANLPARLEKSVHNDGHHLREALFKMK